MAALASFLLPGLVLWCAFALFPAESIPVEAKPKSASDWLLLLPGMVLAGALFGSPIIIFDLMAWRFLHARGLARVWAFAVLGAVSGLTVPLFLGALQPFSLVVFGIGGLLTGVAVWSVAYWRAG